MSAIAPVERIRVVNPVARRDHGHSPTPGEHQHGYEQPAGRNPGQDMAESPHGVDTPGVAPSRPFGQIVNTFAISP